MTARALAVVLVLGVIGCFEDSPTAVSLEPQSVECGSPCDLNILIDNRTPYFFRFSTCGGSELSPPIGAYPGQRSELFLLCSQFPVLVTPLPEGVVFYAEPDTLPGGYLVERRILEMVVVPAPERLPRAADRQF